jgi:hypothetical protein
MEFTMVKVSSLPADDQTCGSQMLILVLFGLYALLIGGAQVLQFVY